MESITRSCIEKLVGKAHFSARKQTFSDKVQESGVYESNLIVFMEIFWKNLVPASYLILVCLVFLLLFF